MKFSISLSVTSANPVIDLPETKLYFLYVTCLFYHFNSSPPLLWPHASFIISVSSLSLLYMFFFQAWARLSLCVWRCAWQRTRNGTDRQIYGRIFRLCLDYFYSSWMKSVFSCSQFTFESLLLMVASLCFSTWESPSVINKPKICITCYYGKGTSQSLA